MDYPSMISELTAKEKMDLAAKLTQAAMSTMNFERQPQDKCQFDWHKQVAGHTLIMFGEMLRRIDSGIEPMRNTSILAAEKRLPNS